MSRTRNTLVLTLLALSSACSGDGPTGPAGASSLLADKAAHAVGPRPAGGRCVTAFNVVGGDAQSFTLAITAVCNLKHLGHTTLVATETVGLVDGALVNSSTYTAANGDKLTSTFAGQVISPPGPDVVFIGTETYTGGTGRFHGASGSSAIEGTATLHGTSGTGQYTITGTITY